MSHLNYPKSTLRVHSKLLLLGTVMFQLFIVLLVVRVLWGKGISHGWLGLSSDGFDLRLGVWCVDAVGKRLLREGSAGQECQQD